MNAIKLPRSAARGWLAAALLLLGGAAKAGAVEVLTVGEAYDLETGESLYRETHCVDEASQSREVIYRRTGGELAARKLLDFRGDAIAPSFVQHNFYSGEVIGVELRGGEVVMSVRDAASLEAKSTVSARPGGELPVVIDAGFDGFVRAHWDELVNGGSKRFVFPFAARESLIELRMRPLTCTYDTAGDQCFRLEMSNWLYRLLAPPIELGYDPESRRLVRYRGLSNIGDANGNGLVVDIRYAYRDIPAARCHDEARRPGKVGEQVDLGALLYGDET